MLKQLAKWVLTFKCKGLPEQLLTEGCITHQNPFIFLWMPLIPNLNKIYKLVIFFGAHKYESISLGSSNSKVALLHEFCTICVAVLPSAHHHQPNCCKFKIFFTIGHITSYVPSYYNPIEYCQRYALVSNPNSFIAIITMDKPKPVHNWCFNAQCF